MCRNIRTLYNFLPPATDDDVHAASLQFVRKIAGFTRPSQANEAAFDRAVNEVQAAATRMMQSLVTTAPPRDRAAWIAKAKERSAKRYALPLLAALVLFAGTGCTAQQQHDTQAQGQDAVLAAAVAAKLASVDIDSSTAVHVAAQNGQITLSGQAVSPIERSAYVAAAKSVDGVHGVRDNLTVNRSLRGIRKGAADAALQVRVSAAIAAQAGVNVFHVTPAVKDGAVTLTGTVPNASVKSTILTTVRGVSGVRRIVDRITVGS